MPGSWFVRGGGKVYGPLDDERLKQLVADEKIDESTDVSRNYQGPWVPAVQVRGLFKPKPSPPLPQPEQASAHPGLHTGDRAASPTAPQQTIPLTQTWTGIGLIWGAALLLGVAALGLRSSTEKRKEAAIATQLENPVANIESAVLYEMFSQNPIKAESLLKNRAVIVTGSVNTIGKDIQGTPYVAIGRGIVGSVLCTFAKNHAAVVGEMTKGQTVTIKGLVKGQNVVGQVEIKECCMAVPDNK